MNTKKPEGMCHTQYVFGHQRCYEHCKNHTNAEVKRLQAENTCLRTALDALMQDIKRITHDGCDFLSCVGCERESVKERCGETCFRGDVQDSGYYDDEYEYGGAQEKTK